MNNTESKLISAVLADKQVHVLLQANVENILRTHNDIWTFIRNYSEANGTVPPVSLVVEKFRDFAPIDNVGATKYHLEELQAEYLNDSLKDILRSTATDVQAGQGSKALEDIIQKTSELKKNTAVIREDFQGLTIICQQVLCLGNLACSLLTQELVSLGYRYILRYRHGSRASHH